MRPSNFGLSSLVIILLCNHSLMNLILKRRGCEEPGLINIMVVGINMLVVKTFSDFTIVPTRNEKNRF